MCEIKLMIFFVLSWVSQSFLRLIYVHDLTNFGILWKSNTWFSYMDCPHKFKMVNHYVNSSSYTYNLEHVLINNLFDSINHM